jgi:hypothetical protein
MAIMCLICSKISRFVTDDNLRHILSMLQDTLSMNKSASHVQLVTSQALPSINVTLVVNVHMLDVTTDLL